MPSRREFAVAALIVAPIALIALAAGERHLAAAPAPAAAGAEWIWQADIERSGEPVALYAAREFELDAVPDSALLDLAGDEAYLLFVNGRYVGSGAYRRGAAIDRYRVDDLLRPGRNRILVELRSLRGAGGLLLRLAPDHGAPLLTSDASWRIYDAYDPALFADAPLTGGAEAWVWRPARAGRWRVVAATAELPRPKLPFRQFKPRRVRSVLPQAKWHRRITLRDGFDVLGPRLIFDWGRPVHGYVALTFANGAPAPPSLLFFGDAPPDVGADDADALVHRVAGSRFWTEPHARSFRYLVILGTSGLTSAAVRSVPANRVAALPRPPAAATGPFGIRPVEEGFALRDIWARLSRPQQPDS